MKRIRLKPKSAEFADGEPKIKSRPCNMPGCASAAEHRAPKDRELEGYYWFCLEHVQEYNKAWNFFSGMSAAQVEEHIIRSALWDRPTKKKSSKTFTEEQVYNKAWKTYHNSDEDPASQDKKQYRSPFIDKNTPEFQALAIMELQPPLDLEKIKTRYKQLAKKHHPDLNKGSKESEELLKTVNMAYTVLKLAFEKFEKLPQKN